MALTENSPSVDSNLRRIWMVSIVFSVLFGLTPMAYKTIDFWRDNFEFNGIAAVVPLAVGALGAATTKKDLS